MKKKTPIFRLSETKTGFKNKTEKPVNSLAGQSFQQIQRFVFRRLCLLKRVALHQQLFRFGKMHSVARHTVKELNQCICTSVVHELQLLVIEEPGRQVRKFTSRRSKTMTIARNLARFCPWLAGCLRFVVALGCPHVTGTGSMVPWLEVMLTYSFGQNWAFSYRNN